MLLLHIHYFCEKGFMSNPSPLPNFKFGMWNPSSVLFTSNVVCTWRSPSIAAFPLHMSCTFQHLTSNVYTLYVPCTSKLFLPLLFKWCLMLTTFSLQKPSSAVFTLNVTCAFFCLYIVSNFFFDHSYIAYNIML